MTSPEQNPAAVELRPQRISNCNLPVNLKDGDLELFSHEIETTLPPTRLLDMRDVSISSDGYLFKGTRILPESFPFPFLKDEWKKTSIVKFLAVNHWLRKRVTFQPDALFITDDWSTGYFHWLSDVLPKLYLVRDRLKDLVLILPRQLEHLQFVKPSLKAFGAENILFLREQETLVCRRLRVVTSVAPSGRYDSEVTRGVRDLIVRYFDGAPAAKDLIYLSRGKAPKRKIANEDEVITLLAGYGFRVIRGEDLSFEEQVKLASSARFLVSNHGAGLTNMLFMKPGTNVLELRHRDDRTNNCYLTLSSAAGLNYFYQNCEAAVSGEDPHRADILVDTGTLRQNIERVLALDAPDPAGISAR